VERFGALPASELHNNTRYRGFHTVGRPRLTHQVALRSRQVGIVYDMKAYTGSRGIAPLILNHRVRLRWSVDFKPRALQCRERTPYPLNKGLCGPHIPCGHFGRKSFAPSGIETPEHLAYSLVTIPTELPRLLHQGAAKPNQFVSHRIHVNLCQRRGLSWRYTNNHDEILLDWTQPNRVQ